MATRRAPKATGSKGKARRSSPKKKVPALLPPSPSRTSARTRIPTAKAKEWAEQPDTTDDEDELPTTLVPAAKAPKFRVRYTAARIERVIDWLEQHVKERQNIFSDSSQDAAEEGRKKNVAKGQKHVFYIALAKDIFSIDSDPKLRAAVATDVPEELWKSVENLITQLVCFPSENMGDSTHAYLLEELKKTMKLPFWERLHGFWRTLPNYNPTLATSDPGQDMAAEALKLTHRHQNDDGVESVIDMQEVDDAPIPDWEKTPSPTHTPRHMSPISIHSDINSKSDQPDVKDEIESTVSFSAAVASRVKKPATSTPSTVSAKPRSTASGTCELGREKHARKMEEYQYKRQKLDYALQKENHQHEREKEEHQLRLEPPAYPFLNNFNTTGNSSSAAMAFPDAAFNFGGEADTIKQSVHNLATKLLPFGGGSAPSPAKVRSVAHFFAIRTVRFLHIEP
ncbi:hypothetical protein B0H17DRAFT_1134806 [Mycena rosella]|uniref:Uncharacterized protein n=1 Tax=Mycena rosella TaxID=1033263 RepID=A0AAD7DF38_MYCRO|nr:hypothetical protein B0H17DRAFT_1134806 [Mycena rosella]